MTADIGDALVPDPLPRHLARNVGLHLHGYPRFVLVRPTLMRGVVIAAVLAGCTAAGPDPATEVADATSGTTAAAAPTADPTTAACTLEETAGSVVDFLRAAGDGAPDVVDRFVSGDRFAWYSVNGPAGRRVDPDARNRSTLDDYLAERHAQSERYELVELSVRNDATTQLAHLAMVLSRRAGDIADGQVTVHGKGALDCASGTIVSWSVGGVVDPDVDLCPGTPRGHGPVVCEGAVSPPRSAAAGPAGR